MIVVVATSRLYCDGPVMLVVPPPPGSLPKVLRDSIGIMDEVDVVLHPLKSELNFPVGQYVRWWIWLTA